MVPSKGAMLALAVFGLMLAPAFLPVADASHIKRIVWPYGVDERWIPIIAGYKVVPDPLPCNHGSGTGTTVLSADFEGGSMAPFTLAPAAIGPIHSSRNQFHATNFGGFGTDTNHGGPGRLYFGNDATGYYKDSFFLIQGSVVTGLDVPAGVTPWYISLNTKWETEWLEGYDHMWVEVIPADGRTYILCTLNPEGRGDTASNDNDLAACSPYWIGICPSDIRSVVPQFVPRVVDPTAPHWEARFVQIPPIWNGQHITIRLTFDSADGVSNKYLGWMVDDVKVTDTVVPVPTAIPGIGNLPSV